LGLKVCFEKEKETNAEFHSVDLALCPARGEKTKALSEFSPGNPGAKKKKGKKQSFE